jgi:hypothetical protein
MQYCGQYHDAAAAIVLDCLTATLPSSLWATEQASISAKLRAVIEDLDSATVVAWAREVSIDAPPAFEQWCEPDRAA